MHWKWKVVAVVAVLAVLGAAPALAHTGIARTELEATRAAPGTGGDLSLSAGTWSAEVLEVDGKPAQAFVLISVDENGDGQIDEVSGIGGHPTVGGVLRSNQVVPAGIARLKLTIWGGGHEFARVKVAINHP